MACFQRWRSLLLLCLLLLAGDDWSLGSGGGGGGVGMVHAWEWTDWIGGGGSDEKMVDTLSLEQVAEMRVRDIKWRLARSHGYSAEEVGRMIDKKELIEALAYEEEKVRLRQVEDLQRTVLQRALLWSVVALVVSFLWPVLQQAKDVVTVNWVVYTDRKAHEARRCWELQSFWGLLGVTAMLVLDLLQVWLTTSVLMSWIIARNAYFFPIPTLTVRPADFLGGDAQRNFGQYGINVGSMVVTWGLRFVHGQLEGWTGRALLRSQQRLRQKGKKSKSSSSSNKKPPKPAPPPAPTVPASTLPGDWMHPLSDLPPQQQQQQPFAPFELDPTSSSSSSARSPPPPPPATPPRAAGSGIPVTNAHVEFMEQLDETGSDDSAEDGDDSVDAMDELD